MGREDLAGDDSLRTLAGRNARREEIDAAVSAWAATREQYEAAWQLQAAGIAAAPVLANWQLLSDPHLFSRGFYKYIEHPVTGVLPYPGWAWQFSRTPAAVYRPAPMFGEHNQELLIEAGLDTAGIRALYDAGIVADEPRL
jgi:crotonobetainyl-CoA:carnitine CoA-transferase CaiB-like acyl-CoA transferase